MRTFQSTKWSWPIGGWISHPIRSTTCPSRTLTKPTEQALALDPFAVSKSIAVKSRGTSRCCHAPPDKALGHAGLRDYAQRMPEMDPLGNPIGFWAIFGVLTIIVILLAAGPLFFVISLVRARRDRPDREQAARQQVRRGRREAARLDEELKQMRERKRPPPPD